MAQENVPVLIVEVLSLLGWYKNHHSHAKVVGVRVACGLDLVQFTFKTIRPKSSSFYDQLGKCLAGRSSFLSSSPSININRAAHLIVADACQIFC